MYGDRVQISISMNALEAFQASYFFLNLGFVEIKKILWLSKGKRISNVNACGILLDVCVVHAHDILASSATFLWTTEWMNSYVQEAYWRSSYPTCREKRDHIMWLLESLRLFLWAGLVSWCFLKLHCVLFTVINFHYGFLFVLYLHSLLICIVINS